MKKLKKSNYSNGKESIFLIFDGECAMCSSFIKWLDLIYKSSKYKLYVTSSIDNLINTNFSKNFDLKNIDFNYLESIREKTLIYIGPNEKLLIRSKAILVLFYNSGNLLLKLIAKFLSIFPKNFLDVFYILISKNRYKLSVFLRLNKNCKLHF